MLTFEFFWRRVKFQMNGQTSRRGKFLLTSWIGAKDIFGSKFEIPRFGYFSVEGEQVHIQVGRIRCPEPAKFTFVRFLARVTSQVSGHVVLVGTSYRTKETFQFFSPLRLRRCLHYYFSSSSENQNAKKNDFVVKMFDGDKELSHFGVESCRLTFILQVHLCIQLFFFDSVQIVFRH